MEFWLWFLSVEGAGCVTCPALGQGREAGRWSYCSTKPTKIKIPNHQTTKIHTPTGPRSRPARRPHARAVLPVRRSTQAGTHANRKREGARSAAQAIRRFQFLQPRYSSTLQHYELAYTRVRVQGRALSTDHSTAQAILYAMPITTFQHCELAYTRVRVQGRTPS